jgi:hypothetical protein
MKFNPPFSFVCVGPTPNPEHDSLPSWMPDFTGSPFHRGLLLTEVERDGRFDLKIGGRFDVFSSTFPTWEDLPNESILALRGIFVDVVEHCLEPVYCVSWVRRESCQYPSLASITRQVWEPAMERQFLGFDKMKNKTQRWIRGPSQAPVRGDNSTVSVLEEIWEEMVLRACPRSAAEIEALAGKFPRITTLGCWRIFCDDRDDSDALFQSCAAYSKSLGRPRNLCNRTAEWDIFRDSIVTGPGDEADYLVDARGSCLGRRFFCTVFSLMGIEPADMTSETVFASCSGGKSHTSCGGAEITKIRTTTALLGIVMWMAS